MMNSPRRTTSIRFVLRPRRKDEGRLLRFLEALGQTYDASEWIRTTLIAALPPDQPKGKPND
jgi:hypothetical protein